MKHSPPILRACLALAFTGREAKTDFGYATFVALVAFLFIATIFFL